MFFTCSNACLSLSNNCANVSLTSCSNEVLAVVFLASLKYLFKPAFECLDHLSKYIWPWLILLYRRVVVHKEVRSVAWFSASDISISNAPWYNLKAPLHLGVLFFGHHLQTIFTYIFFFLKSVYNSIRKRCPCLYFVLHVV